MIENMSFRRLIQTFLCALFIFSSAFASADMYKYLTKDGKTVLTDKRLKGSANKLLKIYRIKKVGAYKSSFTSKGSSSIRNKSKRISRKKYKNKKNRTKNKKQRIKNNSRLPTSMVKANGRDNGIIVGCNSNKHLGRQARLYKNTIQIYSRNCSPRIMF